MLGDEPIVELVPGASADTEGSGIITRAALASHAIAKLVFGIAVLASGSFHRTLTSMP